MSKLVLRAISVAVALSAGSRVNAADPITVDSLLSAGFKVAGTIPSPIGAGLFLEKGPELYACFVSETASSSALMTVYCKPVH